MIQAAVSLCIWHEVEQRFGSGNGNQGLQPFFQLRHRIDCHLTVHEINCRKMMTTVATSIATVCCKQLAR